MQPFECANESMIALLFVVFSVQLFAKLTITRTNWFNARARERKTEKERERELVVVTMKCEGINNRFIEKITTTLWHSCKVDTNSLVSSLLCVCIFFLLLPFDGVSVCSSEWNFILASGCSSVIHFRKLITICWERFSVGQQVIIKAQAHHSHKW